MPYTNQSNYLNFKHRLTIGFCLLVALLILSLVWKIYSSYQNDRKTAQLQTKNFVQAMGAHVVGALKIIDLSLVNSAEAIKVLGGDTAPSPEAVRQLLLTSGRLSDANFWVIFIDAQGRGVAASNNLPIDGVSYADRPYFSSHVDNADGGLYVGAPEVGKVSKRRLFFLSRRVNSATGKFLGVVASPIDASAFATVFTNALFQPALSITLAHTDGKIIARAPKFDESFGSSILKSKLFEKLASAPSGTYEATSVVDGDTRIYSYKTIENMPLVVSVGMASQSWTEGLIDDMLVATVGLGVIIAVLFFSGNFALNSYQKMAASEGDQRRLSDALASSEKRLRLITDNIPALVAHIGKNKEYLFVNAQIGMAFGKDTGKMIGRSMESELSHDVYAHVRPYVEQALAGNTVTFEGKAKAFGSEIYYRSTYVPDRNATSDVVGFFAMTFDITETKKNELVQAAAERRLRTITDNLPVLITYIDNDRIVRFANKTIETWMDIPVDQVINRPFVEIFGPTLYNERKEQIDRALRGEKVDFEIVSETPGATRYLQAVYLPDIQADGTIQGFYTLTTDVSTLKASEQRLALLARTDTLTGLASRYQLNEKLVDAVERQKRSGRPIAVIYLDIDHFKQINDSYGHAIGDLILIEFARRLTTTVRVTDTVGRLAGDEFVIILEGLHQQSDVTEVAEKILQVVAVPFSCGAFVLQVGTSIGIAYAQHPGETSEQLLDRADRGLYVAKSKGRGTFAEEGLVLV